MLKSPKRMIRSRPDEEGILKQLSRATAPPRRILLAMDLSLPQIDKGVVAYARHAGWMLDMRARYHPTLPEDLAVDGIITLISSHDIFGDALRKLGIPLVNMLPWKPELKLPTVLLDNHAAGAMAAEHLMGRGFRHLTMAQFRASSPTSTARCQGFASAVKAAGRQFYPLVCPHPGHAEQLTLQIEWLREQLARLPRPLGLFTEGDAWGVELIHLCQQQGIKVPEEVAIIGVDNDPVLVEVAGISLSSVDTNLHGLGYRAAELLDQLISGIDPPSAPIVIAPVSVVQRQSTDALAIEDDDFLLAVRYIEKHFGQPIGVEDVANQTSLSSRRLQDRFTQHIGRTIAEEITRWRLALAKELLRETKIKLLTIAKQAGFGSADQMRKVFARELGMSPAQYRKSNPETTAPR